MGDAGRRDDRLWMMEYALDILTRHGAELRAAEERMNQRFEDLVRGQHISMPQQMPHPAQNKNIPTLNVSAIDLDFWSALEPAEKESELAGDPCATLAICKSLSDPFLPRASPSHC
eukprot:TRINITY_DN1150_c0_g1_i12.p1 TRINITY_DN1150_c0_g1~~TRINITY_DN1150_c0_g1_i12.p1  ORF type:complete len:116 (+),score=10.93 TRINITY_DN1150_c0_g1_i12:408-755(+)